MTAAISPLDRLDVADHWQRILATIDAVGLPAIHELRRELELTANMLHRHFMSTATKR